MTEAVAINASMGDIENAVLLPKVDMLFESESEAYEFYNEYAESIGFLVRKSTLWTTSKNVVTRRTFVCSREGFREKKKGAKEVRNPRPETRIGCPACMTIRITPSGRYRVTEFVSNHNHNLATIHMLMSKKVRTKARAARANLVDYSVVTPEFENEDEAYEFYSMYAGRMGFSVRKASMTMTPENVITRRMFVCSREGFREKKKGAKRVRKPRPETRTGCPACMTIRIIPSGKYIVSEFVRHHNHQLANPSSTDMLMFPGVETKGENDEADLEDDSVMTPKSNNGFVGRRPRGSRHLSFLSVDLKNYLRSKRMKAMWMGDAGAILEYLQKMQDDNPSFFYAIQVDEDDNLTNFFWADTKSMIDYKHFGDVVCFDTTYKINGYARPFAPFVGVNHHKQTIIFGAALLYDETTESFRWLFETFKTAMFGRQPKTILTDRSAAMSDAIAAVWPGTSHRLCVWHMYQNAIENLNQAFQGSKTFAFDFSRCLFDYEEEEEFISVWETMLENYDLKDNQWLAKLFEDRKKWALVYDRQTFCADIKSTQQRESLNSQLKEYLRPEVDLLCFFGHYERVLDERRCKELQADFNASQNARKAPSVRMLKQAANVYTPAVFKIFQMEFEMHMDCMVYSNGEIGTTSVYKVTVEENPKDHFVRFDSSDGTITCSCQKFEFMGIQCRHVLKVLDYRNIKELPPQYILKRWRKDAKAGSVSYSCGLSIECDPQSSLANRYNYLCHMFSITAARAAKTMESYNFLEVHSDLVMEQVEQILQSRLPEIPSLAAAPSDRQQNQVESVVIGSLQHAKNNQASLVGTAMNGIFGF